MNIFRIDSKTLRYLLAPAKREEAKTGIVCETRIEGITVKKYLHNARYYAYVERPENLPDVFFTTDPNNGHGWLRLKSRKRSEKCRATSELKSHSLKSGK